MDFNRAPRLALGLLGSAGASLQHLQLLMARYQPVRHLADGFWHAAKACVELAALQLVIQPGYGRAIGQQVTVQYGAGHHAVVCSRLIMML